MRRAKSSPQNHLRMAEQEGTLKDHPVQLLSWRPSGEFELPTPGWRPKPLLGIASPSIPYHGCVAVAAGHCSPTIAEPQRTPLFEGPCLNVCF